MKLICLVLVSDINGREVARQIKDGYIYEEGLDIKRKIKILK